MATFTKRTSKTGTDSHIVAIRKRGAKTIYKTFKIKATAIIWARETETAIERGTYTNYAKADTMLFSDAVQRYIEEILPQQAQTTITSVGPCLDKIARAFKGITLSNLTADVLIDYTNERKSKIKDSTILTHLSRINQVLNACQHVWDIDCPNNILSAKTKCRMTRTLKADKGRERRPTQSEINAIINFTRFAPINLIADFAIQTAMRRFEITLIKYNDINYSARTLHIPKTKNGEPRTIPLTTRAIEILKIMTQDALNINGHVFNFNPNVLTARFKKMCAILKIEDLRFHDLRHEATSRFFETTNFSVIEVASITGHKNLQMLKRYTHVRAEYLAKQLA